MNPGQPPRSGSRAWWLGPWGAFAVLVALGQFWVFWIVSPEPTEVRRAAPPAKHRFLVEAGDPVALEHWRWLFTPALFIQPSGEDYSRAAWMQGSPLRIEIEAPEVPDRPLPWRTIRGEGLPGAVAHLDPASGGRWEFPMSTAPVPEVGPVPLPRQGRVRIVAGFAGRVLEGAAGVASALASDPATDAGPARPAVIRIAVDERGDLTAPPVLWESSEAPALDELALRLARGLRLNATDAAGIDWGLLSFDWPVRPAAEVSSAPPART